jgi:hypothetical protein
MSVADDVLALHEDIIEAIILEEHSGEHSIVDHVQRESTHSIILLGKKDQLLLPEIILSVATQFRPGFFPPKMVAVPYGDVGVLFCQLTDTRVMVVTAHSASLPKVMELTSDYLQKFAEKESGVTLIKSANEAEQVVRRYLENRHVSDAAKISVDDVVYRKVDNRWIVSGSWRGTYWFRSKHYLVEVDAGTGLIMRFNSTVAPRSVFRILGFVCLSAGLVTVALLVYLVYAFYAK